MSENSFDDIAGGSRYFVVFQIWKYFAWIFPNVFFFGSDTWSERIMAESKTAFWLNLKSLIEFRVSAWVPKAATVTLRISCTVTLGEPKFSVLAVFCFLSRFSIDCRQTSCSKLAYRINAYQSFSQVTASHNFPCTKLNGWAIHYRRTNTIARFQAILDNISNFIYLVRIEIQ